MAESTKYVEVKVEHRFKVLVNNWERSSDRVKNRITQVSGLATCHHNFAKLLSAKWNALTPNFTY